MQRRPAWRSARSSAADSYVQRAVAARRPRARGGAGNRSSASRWSQNDRASSRRRAAGSGPAAWSDVVVGGVVDDVLADALACRRRSRLTTVRHPREGARDVALEALERVVLDRQRQVGDRGPRARSCAAGAWAPASSRATSSSSRSSSSPRPTASSSAGAELDQRAALLDEVERLAQPGLAGVEAADDLLEPRGRGLVACSGVAHRALSIVVGILARPGIGLPVGEASAELARACAAASRAVVTTSPSPSSTTA